MMQDFALGESGACWVIEDPFELKSLLTGSCESGRSGVQMAFCRSVFLVRKPCARARSPD